MSVSLKAISVLTSVFSNVKVVKTIYQVLLASTFLASILLSKILSIKNAEGIDNKARIIVIVLLVFPFVFFLTKCDSNENPPIITTINNNTDVMLIDAKIAGIAHDRGKGIIICVNKWDAIEKNNDTVKEHTDKIRQILSFMPYAEIMYVSAVTGQRLHKLYDMIDMVIENQTLRIATGVLNEIITEAVALQQPPSDKGKRLKLFYITQVAVKPPTFVIFVNDKELMHFSYTRYIENRIREAFGFKGTPIVVSYRQKGDK